MLLLLGVLMAFAPLSSAYDEMSMMTPKAVMFTVDVTSPHENNAPGAADNQASADNQKLEEMVRELSTALMSVKNEQDYMEVRERTHRSTQTRKIRFFDEEEAAIALPASTTPAPSSTPAPAVSSWFDSIVDWFTANIVVVAASFLSVVGLGLALYGLKRYVQKRRPDAAPECSIIFDQTYARLLEEKTFMDKTQAAAAGGLRLLGVLWGRKKEGGTEDVLATLQRMENGEGME